MTKKLVHFMLLACLLPFCRGLTRSLFGPARFAQIGRMRLLSEKAGADLIDSLATDNFKLLLDDPRSKPKTESFFDFPEMKLLAQQQLNQGQQQIQDFVKSKETKTKPNRVKLLFARRKQKVRNLNSVKLSAEVEDLLPDLTETLEILKPRRRHRKLVVNAQTDETLGSTSLGSSAKKAQSTATAACTESEQLSGKCTILQIDKKSRKLPANRASLKNFERFDQAFSKNVRISNQRVLARYDQAMRKEIEAVEKNYQSFLIYATEKYMQLQARAWLADQTAYNRAAKRASVQNANAISAGISAMVKKLAQFHRRQARQGQKALKEKLKSSLIDMQNKYNDAYVRDQTEANQMISKLEDERLNEWKNAEKDNKFIEKQLIGSL